LSSLWYTPTVVLWLLTWLAAPPASLGEAALKESIRRQATTKSTATLTNIGREMEPPPAAAVSGMPPPPEEQAAAAGATGAAGAPAKAVDPGQDEQWWRARMNNARLAVDRDNLLIDALQSRINALQADVVNIDDPVQQGKARQNLGKALTELDSMKQKRDTDLKSIAAIQDEARRSSVPPGWIR
jgi:hypothetical protein